MGGMLHACVNAFRPSLTTAELLHDALATLETSSRELAIHTTVRRAQRGSALSLILYAFTNNASLFLTMAMNVLLVCRGGCLSLPLCRRSYFMTVSVWARV